MLRAALLDPERSVAAWRAWRDTVDLDAVDPASYRLLPLVWHNLERAGVEDPGLERCRGIYRHTWSKNHLLVHRATPVLGALRAAGVPMLVLKGRAIAELFYPSLGTRPMNDLDILVPTEHAETARSTLEGSGWRPTLDLPKSYLHFIHALGYADGIGAEIDLHWHALWEGSWSGADDPFWADAQRLRFGQLDLLTLSPTDHLFHVCVHGLRWSEIPPIHWIADAARILGSTEVDWTRLETLARRGHVTLQLIAAIELLEETLELDVPAGVLSQLRALPVRAGERVEMWARTKPPSLLRGLWLHWCDHRRRSRHLGAFSRWIGFPLHLQTAWGLEDPLQLPTTAARKIVERLLPARSRRARSLSESASTSAGE